MVEGSCASLFHSVKPMKPGMMAYPRDNIQSISGNQLIFSDNFAM